MKNEILDNLVSNGDILHYELQNVDENGNVGQESKFRNTERLTIAFASGKTIIIDTFCSGSAEDTTLCVSNFEPKN